MTRKQIEKKLAGFNPSEVSCDSGDVVVCVEYEERNGFGICDEEKTYALAKQVAEALGWGFNFIKTGYGALVLDDKPISTPDIGDWNDKSSRWHY